VTPVQKVIQMLQTMSAKGKEEKKEEEVTFAKFKTWCGTTAESKTNSIADAADTIDSLQAELQKLATDVKQLSKDIARLDKSMDTWATDKKAAAEVRRQERDDYKATHKDYDDSIDATDKVIEILKAQSADKKQQSDALLQMSRMAMVPSQSKRVLIAYLQGDGIHEQAPEANAYEFQSGGIVEMVEKLKNRFREEKTALEKAEQKAKSEYELLVQNLEDETEGAKAERTRKSQSKSKKQERTAAASEELQNAEKEKAADEKYLSDLNTECRLKSSDFENRQKLRQSEVEAIEQAVDILTSASVSGAADKHLPGLAQTATSFVQLRRAGVVPQVRKALEYLQAASKRIGSKQLLETAEKAANDPFGKVKKLISDMIVRLMEQANEEAEQQGWCTTELATNKNTRDTKTAAVETLQGDVEQLTASISKATAEIGDLNDGVQGLEADMARATEERNEEKAENAQTVKDAEEAQSAVKNALAIIKDFYESAAGATSLAQGVTEDAPETFSEPYKGMQSDSGGIVGMLEVIQSDFVRLEADTKAGEAEAEREYDDYMNEAKDDKAIKETDINNLEAKKTDMKEDLQRKKQELKSTTSELEAAQAYFEKLRPSCVDSGVSYEQRVAQRKEEIESLQTALKILNGDDIPMPIESGRPEYDSGASHQTGDY